MPDQAPQGKRDQWIAIAPGHYGALVPDVTNSWKWFINTLDEVERRNRLPRSRFDMPVQERYRRAS